jgi:hypothetical protein
MFFRAYKALSYFKRVIATLAHTHQPNKESKIKVRY